MTAPTEPWWPLRTERLVLREFRATDLDDIQAYAGDREVTRFLDWGPNTPEQTREFLAGAIAGQAAWPRFEFGFALDHLPSGRMIGSASLRLVDAPNRTVEVGYCLNRDFWGQGLMPEAARALAQAAFGRLGLHRLVATCDARNVGSSRVMEKLGMRREGLFRTDRQIKGAWRDTFIYAILAEEWTATEFGFAADAPSA
jgi:ribosomal-protein-alanine N-acetyltransferase